MKWLFFNSHVGGCHCDRRRRCVAGCTPNVALKAFYPAETLSRRTNFVERTAHCRRSSEGFDRSRTNDHGRQSGARRRAHVGPSETPNVAQRKNSERRQFQFLQENGAHPFHASGHSGIALPDLLGAVTRDVPPINETQRRFFHAAFIDCIRAALMKCAT